MVVGIEAGLSMDPKDPGNFTLDGRLKGTKYGISARAFPNEDIANLTIERAKFLAKPKYWDTVRGDELVPALAWLMFDSSYNEGDNEAVKHLQKALGVEDDGDFGPQTMAAVLVAEHGIKALLVEYTTQRCLSYTRDRDFNLFSHSWIHRTALMLANAVAP